MIKAVQIGFLIGAAILIGLFVLRYPLIVSVIAVVMVLLLASAIKSGKAL